MSNYWVREFTPVEIQAAADLGAVVNSVEWFIHASSGLMAIVLFTIAAKRSKDGDTIGAVFASTGAVVSAIAPIIAKSFSIGG